MARYKGINQLSGTDRIVVGLMIVIPTILVLWLVWLPAIGSVLLSFTNWNGIGSLGDAKWMGLKNYHDVVTIYPPFWPAVRHNLIWLAVTFLVVDAVRDVPGRACSTRRCAPPGSTRPRSTSRWSSRSHWSASSGS